MTFPELEALAHRLADAAAAATLPRFRINVAAEAKGTSRDGYLDPVTEADRAAEEAIRGLLARDHPDHGIAGEEFAAHAGDGRYEWVVDPIDGTRSFLSGVPLWVTILGLRIDGAPRLGLVDQPYIGDRFWGGGGAAWQRDRFGETRRLRTRPCARLSDATLMTTAPELITGPGARARFDRIAGAARFVRYGADGYAYCLLAAGHVDLVVETGLQPYDIGGVIPVVEAAGGVVTSWEGGAADQGGSIVAAGDSALHAEVLRRLRE